MMRPGALAPHQSGGTHGRTRSRDPRGTVVDGTGAPARTADVAITDGIVTEVGKVDRAGTQEIDADGALVTPGFVDIHTHYDGQATWDEQLTPSCWHGVTTVVMGNCGVGFAPVAPDRHEWPIGLMEGVEDIPGAALSAGMCEPSSAATATATAVQGVSTPGIA